MTRLFQKTGEHVVAVRCPVTPVAQDIDATVPGGCHARCKGRAQGLARSAEEPRPSTGARLSENR